MPELDYNYSLLEASYLFGRIAKESAEFKERTGIEPMKLGIGNTTEPLTPTVIMGMQLAVESMGHVYPYNERIDPGIDILFRYPCIVYRGTLISTAADDSIFHRRPNMGSP